MNRDLKKYLKLHTALVNEKAKLEARLSEISKVLGQDVSAPAPTPAPAATPTKGKRTFSAATKAKMAAAQKARWAKLKGKPASDTVPTTATASAPATKKKRKMSAAGKANIRAAVKARWAKVKAAKKS